jgi:hypothetical protein
MIHYLCCVYPTTMYSPCGLLARLASGRRNMFPRNPEGQCEMELFSHGQLRQHCRNQSKGVQKVPCIAPLVDPRTEVGTSEDVGQASVEAPRKTPPQFLSATCIIAIAPKLPFPQQSALSSNMQPGKYRAGMAKSRRLVVASLRLDWVHYSPRPCCGCYGSRSIVSL